MTDVTGESGGKVTRTSWQTLNEAVKGWWEGDLRTAQEGDIRADEAGTLLFLPYPYSTAGGSETVFPEMYGWDTYFINRGMLLHGRFELVRNHILNHLFMIARYGMVLNGNRSYYLSRSQTPLLADSVWHYAQHQDDPGLLMQAYPLLRLEYEGYWNAAHHRTPTGLATARDLGDPNLRAELASEAETGLDFCALYGGDARGCVPLIVNCALVRYARVLAWLAETLGRREEAEGWLEEAELRAERIRALCWDEDEGFFFEYNYLRGERLPVRSLCAYWTLWAEVATPAQAERLALQLGLFEHPGGLAFTDKAYSSPHPEFKHLQWQYPAGWPPMHIVVTDGLSAYGYQEDARRIAGAFLNLMLGEYAKTGKLWEKYNVVTGGTEVPLERYPTPPHHGWSSAAVAVLGERVYGAAATTPPARGGVSADA
jgi:alpha,alpha-trehalase